MHFYRKCWFDLFKEQFISLFELWPKLFCATEMKLVFCPIANHCIQHMHSQAMLEGGVCELAHSFFLLYIFIPKSLESNYLQNSMSIIESQLHPPPPSPKNWKLSSRKGDKKLYVHLSMKLLCLMTWIQIYCPIFIYFRMKNTSYIHLIETITLNPWIRKYGEFPVTVRNV